MMGGVAGMRIVAVFVGLCLSSGALGAVKVSPEKEMDAPSSGGASNFQEEVVSASGAGVHLVVWRDSRNGTVGDIYAARVSAAGVVLDPTGIPVCAADGEQDKPAVAFDG